MRRLGHRIRQFRGTCGWAGKEIMLKEFNRKQWQRLETGRQGASVATLLKVCEVLGVNLATLVDGLDDGIYEERPQALPRYSRSADRKKRPN